MRTRALVVGELGTVHGWVPSLDVLPVMEVQAAPPLVA
jgi:hypothetical protein